MPMTDYIRRLQTTEEIKAEIEKGKLQDIEDYKEKVQSCAVNVQNRIIQTRGDKVRIIDSTYGDGRMVGDVQKILIEQGLVTEWINGSLHCYLPNT